MNYGGDGVVFSFPFAIGTGYLCAFLDGYFERRYKRPGGRLAPTDSTSPNATTPRKSSHFPIVLLWIPYCFINTYLVTACGYQKVSSIRQKEGEGSLRPLKLTRDETLHVANLGALIGAPAFPFVVPLTILCLFFLLNSMWDVVSGEPEGNVCTEVLLWYGRQFEAFCWLFQRNVPPTSSDSYVSLGENANND